MMRKYERALICIMKKCILSLLMFCIICAAQSQVLMNKDSLLHLLPVAKEDTAKVHLLISIGQQYELNDYATAKQYYLKAKSLSAQIGYKKGLVKFISNYTYVLNAEGRFDSSMLLNKQSILLSRQLNDPVLEGKSYMNTGNVFNNMGMYDSAISYYLQGRSLIEKYGDEILVAQSSDILQQLYTSVRQYDKGIQHGEFAVVILRKHNDPVLLGQSLSNLANNYLNVGKTENALKMYREALSIGEDIGFDELQQTALLNIGNVHLQQQHTDSLMPYFSKTLTLSQQNGNIGNQIVATRGIAVYYLFKKDFETALQYINESIELSKKNNFKHETAKSLETKSSILYTLHDVKAAEKILMEVNVLSDSIRGDETQALITNLDKKYETEKKETQIKLQQITIHQKNILNYILIGSAIALLIILLLSYRNYRNSQKLQQQRISELETEKQLTATEAVLKGEEQERTRLAKDLHDGLGGMLSGIKYSFQTMKGNLIMTPENQQAFERSIDMLDSSIKEMRRVAHNMMPESLLKFGLDSALKDFCSDINQSGVLKINYQSNGLNASIIDQTTAITIYRIVQELVNNTIKHAGASSAIVQVDKSDQGITLTVEDDGKGFDTKILENKGGIGWSNIQSRIDYLKGKLDVQSTPGKGTSVLVELSV